MVKHLPLLLLFLAFLSKNMFAQCPTVGNTVTVTTTNPTGTGSLANAITCANTTTNITNIVFNIPGAGSKLIRPTSALPTLSKAGASIDGNTQGSTVILDGSLLTAGGSGLTLSGNNISIQGLFIRNFNTPSGNGISILSGNGADISGNRISGNRNGLTTGTPVQTFTISENTFGLDLNGAAQANTQNALNIAGAPTGGVIIGNTIANSGASGVSTLGGNMLISNNSIYCNATKGITRTGTTPAVPVITRATTQQIRGTAAAGRVIEIFVHNVSGCTGAPCQGRTLLGTVTTPATGIWMLDLAVGQLAAGSQVTATSTQNGNNTSEFSACATVANCATLNATATAADVSCFGANNGTATAAATGGNPTAGYTFVWNIGATTPTISNLAPGTYTVTVSDVSGCTDTATASVDQPDALTLGIAVQNIACFGSNTGAATANPAGGTPNYTYRWNTGQTTQTISNLAAGTYTATAIDQNGCRITQSVTLTAPPALALSVSAQNIACFGGNTGAATANPAGGTSPYAYLWSNTQTTQSISMLTAGIYTVTLRDVNGCTTSRSVTIGQAPALTLSVSTQNIVCFGANTGTATANPGGGTPAYSYLWSTAQTTQSISNLPAGTYTVTLSDLNGCSTARSATIGQAPALNLSISAQNAACFGENTGAATANPSGGTPNYSYRWNTGQTLQTISNIGAGNYMVTATDANGCTISQSVTVGQAPALMLSVSAQNAACFGENTGTATATASGGTPNYTYLWSNTQTTQTISNLVAGVYTVTLRDANGCTSSRSATIGQPPALGLSFTTQNAACFGGNTGSATTNPSGGSPGYTYLWSNAQTTQTIGNLAAGTYTVTVRDVNGCTLVRSTSIGQPTSALNLTLSSTPETALNANNGTATAAPGGGTPNYTYAWSNGANTATLTNLPPGTYTVTVRDANNCTISNSVTVNPFVCAGLILGINTIPVTCQGLANGSATAVPNGSSGYTFLWSNGATAQTIGNLVPGTYTATVTDPAGCTASNSGSVSEPPALTLAINSTGITCNGFSDGTASMVANGGTPTYTYAWSNGQTTQTINGLAAGTYTATLTDGNGCSSSRTATIGQPSALNLSFSTQSVACFGGNSGGITTNSSGGTPTYTYLWNNAQTTQNLNNLTSGTYTVTLRDANGCTLVQSTTVGQPSTALGLNLSSTPETAMNANNGTATATPVGGTPNYTYAWSNGGSTAILTGLAPGTYTVTVRDANNCSTSNSVSVNAFVCAGLNLSVTAVPVTCQGLSNGSATATPSGSSGYTFLWSTGATAQTINNLVPATYTATVTDAAGCTATNSATVNEPPLLTLTVNSSNVTCNGLSNGTANAVPSGGTPDYQYIWSNGQSTQNIAQLAPGTYTVTLRDAKGCSAQQTVEITQMPALSVTVDKTDETALNAQNGSAVAVVSGGNLPYSYLWSNGSTTAALTGLPPGTYTVTVTDANTCTFSQTATIAAFGCTGLSLNILKTDVSCNGLANGTAMATPVGGTAPFLYNWSNGQTTQNLNNLTSGMYTATVSDAGGCTAVQTTAIAQPFALTVVVTKTDESAANLNDGQATATATGGTPALQFLWSTGATTAQIANLGPGLYFVTVSDANGCTQVASAGILPGNGGGNACTTLPVYAVLTPAKVCGNEPFILEIDDLYPNPLLRYHVFMPNGDSLTAAKTSVTIRPRSTAFSGAYFVVRDSLGCRSKAVGGALVEVVSLPPTALSAGTDTVLCSEGTVALKATAPAANNGSWTSLGKASVDSPLSPTTNARNLVPGDNRFVWKIALPGCPNAATDTVSYFLETPPLVSDDRFTLSRASDVAVLEILLNDKLIGLPDTIVSQVSAPAIGTLEYLSEGKRFRYTVEDDFRGIVSFQYAVCSESISACGFGCDTATVTLEVLNLPKVPEGLVLEDPGPNGNLTIKGVSAFERVEILIFNRWGDLVYANKQYDNAQPWKGTFKGKNLPQGAYYYQLQVFDKGNQTFGGPQTGVVHLFDQN